MGSMSYEYLKKYRQDVGIVRIALHVPKAVKEEIKVKAAEDGKSMTDWILSQLPLETYEPQK